MPAWTGPKVADLTRGSDRRAASASPVCRSGKPRGGPATVGSRRGSRGAGAERSAWRLRGSADASPHRFPSRGAVPWEGVVRRGARPGSTHGLENRRGRGEVRTGGTRFRGARARRERLRRVRPGGPVHHTFSRFSHRGASARPAARVREVPASAPSGRLAGSPRVCRLYRCRVHCRRRSAVSATGPRAPLRARDRSRVSAELAQRLAMAPADLDDAVRPTDLDLVDCH